MEYTISGASFNTTDDFITFNSSASSRQTIEAMERAIAQEKANVEARDEWAPHKNDNFYIQDEKPAKNDNLGNTDGLITSANKSGDSVKNESSKQTEDAAKQAVETKNALESAGAASIALDTKYQAKNSRLVNFSYIDGSTDDQHRAYLVLEPIDAEGQGVINLCNTLISDKASVLFPIIQSLQRGYTSMIITNFQEQLEEKQAVMPTVGDTFSLTFSGKQPNLITISGYLPFDYSDDQDGWYLAYLNAYKFIFRASILAKFHCQLRIIFPDFSSYIIYPVNFNSTMSSEADNLIPFSMSAFVTSFGLSSIEEYVEIPVITNDPSKVGILSANSTFGKAVANLANNYSNNKGVKGITTLLKQGTGAIDFDNLTSYGSRQASKKRKRGST